MDRQITLHSRCLASFKGLLVCLVTILLFENFNFKTPPSIFIIFGIKSSFQSTLRKSQCECRENSVEAKIWSFQPKFGYFGHFGQILTIQMLFGLFMQNGKVSKQYFLNGQTDNISFQIPGSFQKVIGIFGEDITV